MKALFWKEIRENLKWALIALGVLSLALCYVWQSVASRHSYEAYHSICSPSVLAVMLFGSLITATALGFLQIFPEQSRDRWAFLVHRPAKIEVLFLGKAAAGLALYFTAVTLPFLCLCFWAALPGTVAGPFYWGMALAGFTNILIGVSFYFLAILCAMRPAKWFGSKLLPLVGGVFILALSYAISRAPLAFLAAGLFMALSFTAALFSFSQTENKKRLSWRMIPLTLLSLLGCTGVSVFVIILVSLLTQPGWYGTQRSYRVMKDGTPVYVTTDSTQTQVTRLDGSPFPLTPQELEKFHSQTLETASLAYQDYFETESKDYRKATHWFKPESATKRGRWFYLHDRGYFVRYSNEKRLIDGYIGKRGFSDAVPSENERFQGSYKKSERQSNELTYLFKGEAYWIDLLSQQVTLLQTSSPENELIASTTLLGKNSWADPTKAVSVILSGPDRELNFYEESGALLFQSRVEKDPEKFHLYLMKFDDNSRFFLQYDPISDYSGKIPGHLSVYDSQGNQLSRQELSPLKRDTRNRDWQIYLIYPTFGPGPYSLYVGGVWYSAHFGYKSGLKTWQSLIRDKEELFKATIIIFCFGLLSAVVGMFRMRHYHFTPREQAVWTLFLFLTGIPGFLTFLAVQAWPTRHSCAACGQARPVNSEHCPHCHSEWPQHQPDGTEIFVPSP